MDLTKDLEDCLIADHVLGPLINTQQLNQGDTRFPRQQPNDDDDPAYLYYRSIHLLNSGTEELGGIWRDEEPNEPFQERLTSNSISFRPSCSSYYIAIARYYLRSAAPTWFPPLCSYYWFFYVFRHSQCFWPIVYSLRPCFRPNFVWRIAQDRLDTSLPPHVLSNVNICFFKYIYIIDQTHVLRSILGK